MWHTHMLDQYKLELLISKFGLCASQILFLKPNLPLWMRIKASKLDTPLMATNDQACKNCINFFHTSMLLLLLVVSNNK